MTFVDFILLLRNNSEVFENESFKFNSRRRTGSVFNRNALEKFLKTHNLNLVIRAHQVVNAGFKVT
jgi:hypothetical protein